MIIKNIKNIFFLLIFILLSNNLFANGNGEFEHSEVNDVENMISLHSVSQKYNDGYIQYLITSEGGRQYTHLVTIDEEEGIPRNSNGEIINIEEWTSYISTMEYNADPITYEQIHERDLILRTAEIKYLANEKLRKARVKPDEQYVTIPTGLNDKEYTFIGIDAVNNKLESFTIKITPNFFPGESKFYSSFFNDESKNLVDSQKRALFMSTFFSKTGKIESNKESIEFMEMINDDRKLLLHNIKPGEDSINLNFNLKIEDYIKSDSKKVLEDLKLHQELFKRAFIAHFNINIDKFFNPDPIVQYKEYEAPFLDIKAESFKSLYGKGEDDSKYRSDYLFSYLTYSKNKAKPLLSYIISNKIDEKYDYTKYREVSPVEGDNIARAALKYMTWGVEYTPLVSSKQVNNIPLENNLSNTEVFKDNNLLLKDWVYSNNNSVNYKNTNYLNPDNVKVLTNSLNIPNNSDFNKLYDEGYITTPFLGSDGKAIAGNPIAYCPLGTDTPKSFNYKLFEQQKVKKWMYNNSDYNYQQLDTNTTLGNDKNGNDLKQLGYITEIDLYRDFMKSNGISSHISIKSDSLEYNMKLPNLSDLYIPLKPYITYHSLMESRHNLDYMYSKNSMFNVNKMAGVDSIGLLAGSLATALTGETTLLNVFNQNNIKNIDTYNNNLNPLFHNSTNIDHYRMRLNKSDIERSSILLPDLSQARKGDILVNFTKDYPHIGIIIEADFSNLPESPTTEDYMKRIKVLSTKNGYRMANIGSWYNEGNVFSGFSKKGDEKNYHLRRLVVIDKPNKANDDKYVKDKFELFDVNYLGLFVHLDMTSNYIPNTGELLKIDSINITADIMGYGNGNPENGLTLDKKNNDIIILSPKDMYRLPKLVEESNIYNNKGSGLKFYALDDKIGSICLATFEIMSDIEVLDEFPYKVIYNYDIFKSNGRAKNKFRLFVNNNNKLVFEYKVKGITRQISKFGVRPIYPYEINGGEPTLPYEIVDGKRIYDAENQVKFGDDFLLRFALQSNNSVQGTTPDFDFLEIYNKKLLWTSNLFSDRRSGNNPDWNVDFPWNAPPRIKLEENLGVGPNNDHYKDFKFLTFKSGELVPDSSELIWYGENRWNFDMGDDFTKYEKVFKYVLQELEYSDLEGIIDIGDGRQNLSIKYDKDNPNITISYNPGLGWQDSTGEYVSAKILFNGLGGIYDYDEPIKNYKNVYPKYFADSIQRRVDPVGNYHGGILLKTANNYFSNNAEAIEVARTTLDEVKLYYTTKELEVMMNKYYSILDKNYAPRDINGDIITNILPYLLKDKENNKVFTRYESMEAILNSEIEFGYHLYRSGWSIEAKDVYHENGYAAVKLLHTGGGECIFNMSTGEPIKNQEYGNTFNVYAGPYDFNPFSNLDQTKGHLKEDVITWILWGGGPNDTSDEEERYKRFVKGLIDGGYGNTKNQWPRNKGLTDQQALDRGGIIPVLRVE